MEKLSERQLERLRFAEIEVIKRAIQRIEQSGYDTGKIKSKRDRLEDIYAHICADTIKEILEFAPSLQKVNQTYLAEDIKNRLRSFDYRLGMQFFDHSKRSIFKSVAPIRFIENTKHAICVQILTRSLNCLFDIGLTQENIRYVNCRDVDYVFITHDHLDHCSGLEFFPQDTKTIFVANKPTQDAIFKQIPGAKKLKWQTFKTGEEFKIQDMEVSTIPLKHDCIENVAYKLNDEMLESVYMVDFGEWSESEIEFCNEADRIIIEAYYDDSKPIEKSPLELRRRSSHGHLSIQAANEFIKKLTPKTDREIYFCHC